MCTTHVFIGSDQTVLWKNSKNVDACAVGVYQALLSPHEREPGFEARSQDNNRNTVEMLSGIIIVSMCTILTPSLFHRSKTKY